MSLEWIFLVLPSLGIMKQCTKDYCTRRILLLLRAADRMSFIFKMNPMFFSNMGTICGSTWQPAAMGLTIQCTHNTFCGAKIRHIAFNDKAGYYFKLDLTWTPSFLHVMHFNHITMTHEPGSSFWLSFDHLCYLWCCRYQFDFLQQLQPGLRCQFFFHDDC